MKISKELELLLFIGCVFLSFLFVSLLSAFSFSLCACACWQTRLDLDKR